MRPGTTQDEIRRRNVSALLTQVHVNGSISRAELTSLMGLNRSTIKGLVAELEDAGLVSERIPETSHGAGRPSHVVVPHPASPYVLAANVGVDAVSLAAVGLGGAVIARKEYRWHGQGAKPQVLAGRLAAELTKLGTQTPPGSRAVGVGVGLPGTVRRSDGFVVLAPNLEWRGVPFAELLRGRLGGALPIRIGNDGDLGALSEHVRGAGRDVSNMIYLQGEVGLGGGLIVDGHMLEGAGGFAGEIGHMNVCRDGRVCRCGSRGCLETEVGEEALLIAAGRACDGGRRAVAEVFQAAGDGEQQALDGVRAVARSLGIGVASLVNIFNPEVVILGGSLVGLLDIADDVLARQLDDYCLGAVRHQVRLSAPGLGDESSLFGAAELAFESLLHDPFDSWWMTRAGALA